MAGGRAASNILFSGKKTKNCRKRFCTALEMFKQNILSQQHYWGKGLLNTQFIKAQNIDSC
jgi:hypothetical protein